MVGTVDRWLTGLASHSSAQAVIAQTLRNAVPRARSERALQIAADVGRWCSGRASGVKHRRKIQICHCPVSQRCISLVTSGSCKAAIAMGPHKGSSAATISKSSSRAALPPRLSRSLTFVFCWSSAMSKKYSISGSSRYCCYPLRRSKPIRCPVPRFRALDSPRDPTHRPHTVGLRGSRQ